MSLAARCLALLFLVTHLYPLPGQERRDIDPEPALKQVAASQDTADSSRHYQALKMYLRGRCLESETRILEAIQTYEDVLKIDPKALPAYKSLIPLCMILERDTKALEYCRKALELDPDDLDLLYRYGKEMHVRGQPAEAVRCLKHATELPAIQQSPEILAQLSLELGNIYQEIKKYPEAAAAFERLAGLLDNPEHLVDDGDANRRKQLDQEASKIYERLGRIYMLNQEQDKAIAALNKAQEKDAAHAQRLQFTLAEIHYANSDLPQALEHLRKHLASQPSGMEPYQLFIEIMTKLQRVGEVVPALEQYSAKDSFNQPLKILLAQQYAKTDQARKAEVIFLASLEDYPSEEAYHGLAKVLAQQGRWAELLQRLEKSMSDPKHLAAARPQVAVLNADSMLAKGIAEKARSLPGAGQMLHFQTRRVLASLCRQGKHLDLAEHFCRLCLADDPQPGEVYLELCRVLTEAKKYDALAAVCKEASTKNLKAPAVVFEMEMARALALAGKHDAAIAAAQKTLTATTPNTGENLEAAYNLAIVYYRANQLDKALAECQTLLTKAETPRAQRQVYYLLSGVYSAQKDHPKAEENLQKLLAIDPEDATACNDLGYIMAEQGKNLDEAERLIRKAIDLDRVARVKTGEKFNDDSKDHASFVDSLAWVFFKRGQLDEARKMLERALTLPEGDDPAIYEHLGEVYRDLNQFDKAQQAWEKALKLYQTSHRVGSEDRLQELQDKLKTLSLQRTSARKVGDAGKP